MARKRNRSRSSSGVSRRSVLLLAGVGTASATGAYTTGAFDAVAGDRALDVATADDDTAFLGVSPTKEEKREGFDGESVPIFDVTNRFGSDVEVDATVVEDAHALVDSLDPPSTPVRPGRDNSEPITATLDCEGGGREGPVEVRITAESPEREVELTRPVEVSCVPTPAPEFVFLEGPEADGGPPEMVTFTVGNEAAPVSVGGLRIEAEGPGRNDPARFDGFDVGDRTDRPGGDIGEDVAHDPVEIGEADYEIREFENENGQVINMQPVLSSGEFTVTLLDENGDDLGVVGE